MQIVGAEMAVEEAKVAVNFVTERGSGIEAVIPKVDVATQVERVPFVCSTSPLEAELPI